MLFLFWWIVVAVLRTEKGKIDTDNYYVSWSFVIRSGYFGETLAGTCRLQNHNYCNEIKKLFPSLSCIWTIGQHKPPNQRYLSYIAFSIVKAHSREEELQFQSPILKKINFLKTNRIDQDEQRAIEESVEGRSQRERRKHRGYRIAQPIVGVSNETNWRGFGRRYLEFPTCKPAEKAAYPWRAIATIGKKEKQQNY